MNKHELTALAERVEAAEGPSRELDAEILAFVESQREPPDARWPEGVPPMRYTGSQEAAFTLLNLDDSWLELKGPRRYLNIPNPVPNYWSASVSRWNHEGQVMGWGATPALALTAAALKAQATVAAALRSQAQGEGK